MTFFDRVDELVDPWLYLEPLEVRRGLYERSVDHVWHKEAHVRVGDQEAEVSDDQAQ